MSGRRSICLYTPSTDPSGMGAHMVDLLAEYAATADVALMMRPTTGGRRLLDRAAELGARTVELPSPRHPHFAGVVTGFLRRHPADVFHCHVGTGSEDWDGVRLARGAGCPAVLQTQHLPYLVAHPRKRRAYHHAIEQVDRLIAVSEGLRRTYHRIGVPPERFTTVPNGVAPLRGRIGRDAARAALGLERRQPVVMTLGRLTHMKGQWHLVDTVPGLLARHPDLAVVLVGDGPLRQALEKRAAALGVAGAVRFPGHRSDARQLLDAADVFVLPSRHEGMPLVALEAMEAGLPVVGTRVIGTEEVVVDGVTGALVRPGDPAALGAALERLLADPCLRRRQGAAGRCRYLAGFTRERMAAETAAVYEAALRGARR
ncbi:glycosyltransferase family 4 protein [Geodermatophilus sabuli]|uniref:Glycosyltransferase involved in cell wall bisynthesis n=1 Tax=Geodermatophilus sabuli TaxID=1564158 RepID=A0A285EK38_9ACTN|nr:glycosyltransferase family 4 protein [Geodermatophilus sabuli]MBB3087042.1 glycosyltransferase involved in cell wall biosynthesis [Geodermatophilus sabuli]SNX99380.1 Glycosyltransferase involved in cell wall bisynthesis [Geodermatophilus sabuli]